MKNKQKPLNEKVEINPFLGASIRVKDVKQAVEEAEDFIISMKRDNDYTWNMRLNLIIEEFKTKIFGEFE